MGQTIKSPIIWFGGKGNLCPKLLPLIPKHQIYVEPFGGGASLLFAKQPSQIEVYNDLDDGLYNMFQVIKHKNSCDRLRHTLCFTPNSRYQYAKSSDEWMDDTDPVIKACNFLVATRMSFSGHMGSGWNYVVSHVRRGMSSTASRWISFLEGLPEIHERLQNVEIFNCDFEYILNQYNDEHTFTYLDPPYVPGTRSQGQYRCEMNEDGHKRMLEYLLFHFKGMVMLSGYKNEVYSRLEEVHGWERKDFSVACDASPRTRTSGILGEGSATRIAPRIESVWRNPKCLDACQKDRNELQYYDE